MPLVKNIHVDVALTNLSRATVNTELVAPQIWPIVPVKKDSDVYFEYDNSNLRIEQTLWAPKQRATEVNWETSTQPYKVERHGLSELVEDDENDNADSPIQVMSDTTRILTEKLMLRREKRIFNILNAAGTYPAGHSVATTDRWDAYASATSDPNLDVQNARKVVFSKTGHIPNKMVLPRESYEVVREHPKIFERIKYVQTAVVTAQLLQTLWDIASVVIAGGIENTANEGQADVVGFLWSVDDVYLGWVTGSAALRQPSWGYHIQSQALITDRWRDEERKGEMVRVSYKDVPKLVTNVAGYRITNTIT